MIKELEEFFRPDRTKLGVSTILFGLGSALPNPVFSIDGFLSYGWPLPIYRVTAVMESMPPEPVYQISIIGILVNAVIWYTIGSKITQLYRREKR